MPPYYNNQPTTNAMPNPFLTAASAASATNRGGWNYRERHQENPFLTRNNRDNNRYNNRCHTGWSDPIQHPEPEPEPEPESFEQLFPSLTLSSNPPPLNQIKLNFKSALQIQGSSNSSSSSSNPSSSSSSSNPSSSSSSSRSSSNPGVQNQFLRPMNQNQFLQPGHGSSFGVGSKSRHNECDDNDNGAYYDDAYDSAYTQYYND